MIKNSYSATINTTITCPARDKVLELVSDTPNPKIKTVIGTEKVINHIPLYVDSIDMQNMYGFIKEVRQGDDVLDEIDIQDIAMHGNYEMVLEKVQGKTLLGTLNIMVEEGAACSSSDSELKSEIDTACEEAIANGFVTTEEMDARMAVLRENHVDDLLILRIIRKYRKYNKPSHKPSCIFQDPYLDKTLKKKQEGIIAEGLRAAVSRQAVICEGEKSVGKNVYLETIAWLMNMPMYLITFSRQMSPSSIYGEKTTDNSAAKALAEFDSDILAKAEAVNEKRRFAMNIYAKMGMEAEDAMKNIENDMSEEDKKILQEAARFKMLQAQSSSVNIVIDQSELYDWLVDGGMLVFNEMNMGATCFATNL